MGRPGAISLGEISIHSRRYMIHYVKDYLLWSKGGDNAQGFTARSLSSRAVALRHANASCKTWRYGQPKRGRRRSGQNLSWICVTKGLAYFVRSRWWRRWGGPWTFVLKVLDILRRKRRKVSCCVLVPFACCINPRVGSLGSETLVPPLGGGRLDPHAHAYLAVYLVVPTVCLFKAGLLRGNKPWSQVFDRRNTRAALLCSW